MSTGVLKISDAASLAFHAAYMMTDDPKKVYSITEISSKLKVSAAHLSKVMQRLTRAGLVKSIRGPKGGFVLERQLTDVTLLEIYEIMNGKLETHTCLFGKPVCGKGRCLFGGLVSQIDNQVRAYLQNTRLSDLQEKAYVAR